MNPFERKHIANGDRVAKTSGDYTFEGEIVAWFAKRSGVVRCVVEDDRGVLFIFDPAKLKKLPAAAPEKPVEPKQPPVIRPEGEALLTRSQTGAALRAAGYPVADKTLARKACVGGGPPFRLFGKKPLYKWSGALKWAESQMSRIVTS